MLCSLVVLLSLTVLASAQIRAGVAKVDATLPVGVPLAGYNWGPRRSPTYPIPHEGNYTTFMSPCLGSLEPTWAKALILDDGDTTVCFVTIDAIGSDGFLREKALVKAQNAGVNVSIENFMLSGSHTHSGPGALTPNFVWSIAPATDLFVPEIQDMLVDSIVEAMLEAQANLQPVKFGIGSGILTNVTRNRRADISPYVTPTTIDPNLGIMRLDTMSGEVLATVWNYACHGTCWGPEQMYSNGDILGGVNNWVEANIGGVSLFLQADAGDIDPLPSTCAGMPNFAGAPVFGNKIQQVRASLETTTQVTISAASQIVDFGPANINFTLGRWENCTRGGPLDICTLCAAIHCDVNTKLNSAWLSNKPRFTAVNFNANSQNTLVVTMPGEALSELGFQIRNDSAALGFDTVFLAGYTNDHMGYFATPDEYDVGGYESELTFWGYNTAEIVRSSCKAVASQVAP